MGWGLVLGCHVRGTLELGLGAFVHRSPVCPARSCPRAQRPSVPLAAMFMDLVLLSPLTWCLWLLRVSWPHSFPCLSLLCP